ncbi:MAG TPA: aconitate hydratase AcnA [Longimicrobiales bacterium]|nr:aconitate hydratase AcnA [Longimicrobiales bacterium]
MARGNSFGSEGELRVGERRYRIHRLQALESAGLDVRHLPYSLRILLENLLRHEDGQVVTAEDIRALAGWDPKALPSQEIAFTPSRVILQDFTGVPAVVDLAVMRDAMRRLGGDPGKINPLQPVELVIDHSVQVDEFGTRYAFETNADMEYKRNHERYAFLRWGQTAFDNFRVVPPETGIVHQVNIEYLARVVFGAGGIAGSKDAPWAYPDTLVGTDSHTTMVNGLGVLGWGVGGIEAEAAMLGQAVTMLIPQVVGFKLTGALPEGSTATDLVLRVTEMLRQRGVVGKFVEFYGSGLATMPLADRATIGNMSPEFGGTCAIFPVDAETIRYLELTARPRAQIELVEAYMREQGLFHTADSPEPHFTETLELDMSTVEPSLAGPKRPQDRVRLSESKRSFLKELPKMMGKGIPASKHQGGINTGVDEAATAVADATRVLVKTENGTEFELQHGSVVIAAITSCTNTSNPSVMVGAGLVARKAHALGLTRQPWVKTSLAPGSKVVMKYLQAANLVDDLEALGFNLVGYGCTTCIGNSGPLPPSIAKAVEDGELVVASVLSGNRNFEGRINPHCRANYLASPPLVVAYAIAGRMDIDLYNEPIGISKDGRSVFLKDIWPDQREIDDLIRTSVKAEQFETEYASVFEGDERWKSLPIPEGQLYEWDERSTYVKAPPFFDDMTLALPPIRDIHGARVLALLGDSITTDHISPAGSIAKNSPAAKYLMESGVAPKDFNSYGSRRGNHEVMMRGTFANIRLRNRLVPGVEGGYTRHLPDGEEMSIFDAAMKYVAAGVPTIVIAGKEYGSGSSRDWAAKGPALMGVRAVITESYERIHRSNLIGMGVLPLQFREGDTAEALGLTGEETYEIKGLEAALTTRRAQVRAKTPDGWEREFGVHVRLDTPQEVEYYRHGGILHYVLRQLASAVRA